MLHIRFEKIEFPFIQKKKGMEFVSESYQVCCVEGGREHSEDEHYFPDV